MPRPPLRAVSLADLIERWHERAATHGQTGNVERADERSQCANELSAWMRTPSEPGTEDTANSVLAKDGER